MRSKVLEELIFTNRTVYESLVDSDIEDAYYDVKKEAGYTLIIVPHRYHARFVATMKGDTTPLNFDINPNDKTLVLYMGDYYDIVKDEAQYREWVNDRVGYLMNYIKEVYPGIVQGILTEETIHTAEFQAICVYNQHTYGVYYKR